jgi:polyhydroxyalkanoate synthesis regulator phasin
MKKNVFIIAIVSILFISLGLGIAWAGEMDILMNYLVKKKILTQSEAAEVLDEMQNEMSREREEIKQVATDAATEAAKKETKGKVFKVPAWVQNIDFNGDVRLRYQRHDTDNDANPPRDRFRVRLRAGIESEIGKYWKAGFGLATGGTDPRSTNQTMDNTFDTPDIRLDYAYAQFKPFKMFSIVGGKFKNPLWGTKDLLWDGDIRPEGIAAKFSHEFSNFEVFITPAFFILEEFGGDSNDPTMLAIQPGFDWKIGKYVSFKVAGTYYDFYNVKGSNMAAAGHSAGTNSLDAFGNWAYDHDAFAADAALGIKVPWKVVPYFGLFGQYVKSDADDSVDGNGFDDDTGWLAGFAFGHKKVKKFGQWQFKYNYRELEADAWPDWLPDSDFYNGDTGVEGNEFEFQFGLYKNVTLGLDYYLTQPIRLAPGALQADQDLLQADLVIKW